MFDAKQYVYANYIIQVFPRAVLDVLFYDMAAHKIHPQPLIVVYFQSSIDVGVVWIFTLEAQTVHWEFVVAAGVEQIAANP